MGCSETIFVDESIIDFPIFLLFFNSRFPIFPVFSILSFLFSYFLFFLSNHDAGHLARENVPKFGFIMHASTTVSKITSFAPSTAFLSYKHN